MCQEYPIMIDSTLNHLELKTLKVKFYVEDIEKMKSMSLEERIEYKSKLKSEHRYTYDELE